MIDPAATLAALAEGEIEVVGRIVGLVEQRAVRARDPDLPGPGATDGARCHLQADHRRATARRLPRRDAWRDARWPRGTSRRPAAGGSSRRPSCATDRSARGWSRRTWRPIRTSTSIAMVVGDDERLRRMAVLDAAMNNTDRKGGHILPVDGGRHCLRRGPRRVLLDRAEAPDRALGLAGSAVRDRTRSTGSSGSGTAWRQVASSPRGCGSSLRRPRSGPRVDGWMPCSRPAGSRSRLRRGRRSRGLRTDRRAAGRSVAHDERRRWRCGAGTAGAMTRSTRRCPRPPPVCSPA